MNDDHGLAWVERNWWLLSARGDVPRPNGPERVREAIARDRGERAPSGPVRLCGVPDGTEKTVAEWDREYRRRQPRTPWGKWRRRRECFHHDRLTGQSWIESELIEMGARKMFWCTECGRTWFT